MTSKVAKAFRNFSTKLSFVIMIVAFLFVVMWESIVFTTQAGYVGVIWHRLFWSDPIRSEGPMAEGLHLIFPWDKFIPYSARLQTHTVDYDVVSQDGLHFQVSLAFRWRIDPTMVAVLHTYIGPDYLNTLLIPEVGSITRKIIASYDAMSLYTKGRQQVQDQIYKAIASESIGSRITEKSVRERLGKAYGDARLINIADVLITKLELPPQIRTAIENKLEQAQIVEEYEFRVQREKLESERKAVEAQGIRDFQETVTPAISESYLRWRGIEATLKLAESPNSKVVVIGNSATGLPLILDTTTNEGLSNLPSSKTTQGPSANGNDYAADNAAATADVNTPSPVASKNVTKSKPASSNLEAQFKDIAELLNDGDKDIPLTKQSDSTPKP